MARIFSCAGFRTRWRSASRTWLRASTFRRIDSMSAHSRSSRCSQRWSRRERRRCSASLVQLVSVLRAQPSWSKAMRRGRGNKPYDRVSAAWRACESLDTSGLTALDRQQFAARVEGMNQRRFYFQTGVEFLQGNDAALGEYAAELSALQNDAAGFDYSLLVNVRGSADASGDGAANAELAGRRARTAAGVLATSGVATKIVSEPEIADGPPVQDISKRYVEIDLQLQAMPNLP